MNTETKMTGTEVATVTPADKFRGQIDTMDNEFKAALPDHIPVERFKRVVQTAVNQNPDLMEADRKSLFGACVEAAQDGLMPDGRQAALVIFNTKSKDKQTGKEIWIKKVQYMPMIAGIYIKCRNSGQLAGISANVVYAGDDFEYELGDNERIAHRPNLENRGAPIAVYAVARLKDGTVEREVMTIQEVERVRSVSKSKDKGPWSQWWGEMARKTVIRRLSKRLPMSSNLDKMLHRDDSFYNLDQPDETAPAPRPLRSDYREQISHHPDASETTEEESEDPAPKAEGPTFSFVDWEGAVTDDLSDAQFRLLMESAVTDVPNRGALDGIWESNQDAMNTMRAGTVDQQAWAGKIGQDFDDRAKELDPHDGDVKGERQGKMV